LGISAVVRIEATGTRLSLVVLVIGVAFSAACFLERSLHDYMRAEIQPSGEPSVVTATLPKWLNRKKEHSGAIDRGKGEWRAELRTGTPQTHEGLWCWLPSVGATVPSNLKTYALPPPLIYEMPKLERYTHLKLKGQVLIVNPMTSKIVDMFPAT